MKVKPMDMLLTVLAGWINPHQQDVIMKIHVSLVQGLLTFIAGLLVLATASRRHVVDQGT
jgi:hypothetical protein